MQSSDRSAFMQALVTLSELFGKPISPAVQVLYWDALKDLDASVLGRAMNAAAQGCTFMPKPAELRTLAVGDTEDHAERAWIAFRAAMGRIGSYRSLVTQDPALGETILAMFQSWPQACVSEFSPEMWSSKRKEFGRIYRVMRQRDLAGGRYLAGIVESNNAGRSEWAKYTEIGLIGEQGETRVLGPAEAEEARMLLAAQAGQPTRIDRLLHLVDSKPEHRPDTA